MEVILTKLIIYNIIFINKSQEIKVKKKMVRKVCTLTISSKIIYLGKGQENVMFLETSSAGKDKITSLVTLVEKHFRSVRITASRIGFYQPIYNGYKKIFYSIESIRGDLSVLRQQQIKNFCIKKWDSL